MTPYAQLIKHGPDNERWGDCYRTALGCLLDIPPEQIPHFYDNGISREDGDVEKDRWLKDQGYVEVSIPVAFDTPLEPGFGLPQFFYTGGGAHYLFSGRSVIGNHVVVCKGDQIVHDPAGREVPLVGPGDDGYYWVTLLIDIRLTDNLTYEDLGFTLTGVKYHEKD